MGWATDRCDDAAALSIDCGLCISSTQLNAGPGLMTIPSEDCETVGIPPLMSRKTLGILDGGRGGAVDRSWRRRVIRGVDKGGA